MISAAVIVLCLIVYLVLLFTVLRSEEEESAPTIGNHGEQMASGRPFVIDPIEAAQIQSIKVNNKEGGYEYYRGEDDEFYFRGAEAMLYDNSTAWMTAEYETMTDMMDSISIIDSLMGLSRYMLSNEEVVGYNKDNLAAYGLDGQGKASMEVTFLDKDGNSVTKKVYFGSLTVSGSGYYVRLEGRDAVYILAQNVVERCVFANIKDFFLPQVAPYVSSSVYTDVAKYTIKKNGEVFLSIRDLTDEEYDLNGELFSHVFETPDGYFPSLDNFQAALEIFTNFTGEQVVEWGLTERLKDPNQTEEMTKLFQLYSLMNQDKTWAYELYYSYEDPKFDITVYISPKLEVENAAEGEEKQYVYYVYSPDFDVIVEFNAESLPWVEWDLLSYMDNHSFITTIDGVSKLEFLYGNTNVTYTLQGEGDDLKVNCSTGIAVDTDNFRQLYKAILYSTLDGYAEQPDTANKILSLKITLRNGKVYDYQFYGLTARKAYYTLNGSGEFYINRDYVKQIINACNGILAGETVTVDRKN